MTCLAVVFETLLVFTVLLSIFLFTNYSNCLTAAGRMFRKYKPTVLSELGPLRIYVYKYIWNIC